MSLSLKAVVLNKLAKEMKCKNWKEFEDKSLTSIFGARLPRLFECAVELAFAAKQAEVFGRIETARQCQQFIGFHCKNETCLNIYCPLNKKRLLVKVVEEKE